MSKTFPKGSFVKWAWGQGYGKGEIVEYYKETVHKVLQGSEITRHGTADNPAYLIQQENGPQVLKLHSELQSDS